MHGKNVTTTRVNPNKSGVFSAFKFYAKHGYARYCDPDDPTWATNTMSSETQSGQQACPAD